MWVPRGARTSRRIYVIFALLGQWRASCTATSAARAPAPAIAVGNSTCLLELIQAQRLPSGARVSLDNCLAKLKSPNCILSLLLPLTTASLELFCTVKKLSPTHSTFDPASPVIFLPCVDRSYAGCVPVCRGGSWGSILHPEAITSPVERQEPSQATQNITMSQRSLHHLHSTFLTTPALSTVPFTMHKNMTSNMVSTNEAVLRANSIPCSSQLLDQQLRIGPR